MTDFRSLPLDQLSGQCASCLHSGAAASCDACRELLRRALCSANDAAWDAAAGLLWPLVVGWIYAALPDLAPASAEQLGYRALWHFRQRYTRLPDLAAHFPSLPTLLHDLRQSTLHILSRGL